MPKSYRQLRERNRELARETVLDAAERLLGKGVSAEFSMRELAAEAGVSFATPFNHFGNKNAIMQALSARLITRMAALFGEQRVRGDAVDRVVTMGRVAMGVLLEKPGLSKVVVGSLGVLDCGSPTVHTASSELWSIALADFAGFAKDMAAGQVLLSEQLAYLFRGCVSFWIAGELQDELLPIAFESGALCLMLGYVGARTRPTIVNRLAFLSRKTRSWKRTLSVRQQMDKSELKAGSVSLRSTAEPVSKGSS